MAEEWMPVCEDENPLLVKILTKPRSRHDMPESFWAIDRGDGTYEVNNVLAFLYNVSLADIVTVREVDECLFLKHVVHKSGNRTVRALFPPDSDGFDGYDGDELKESLSRLGCDYEILPPLLIAINVPPAVPVAEVFRACERFQMKVEFGDPQPARANWQPRTR